MSLGDLTAALSEWPADLREDIYADWQVWARDDQLAPAAGPGGTDDSWRTWLFLGGRGAGKTRAGAEWIRAQATGRSLSETGTVRIALIGETIRDVRNTMIDGPSGLMAVHPQAERPQFDGARGRLVWPNGAIAQLFSAERPAGLRGPQFHAAWCDELIKWRHAEETWDMLQFGLRLGAAPRAVVTTTPKPRPLLKRLVEDAATVVTRAKTVDNRAHLAASFISEMERRYAGTALGRQELDGDIIAETSGALWRRDWIEDARVGSAPPLGRVVVAVDPPVTAHVNSDACGIVVAGRGPDQRGYVVADRTLKGRAPSDWAAAVVAAFHDFEADAIVAEVNQGGDLVEQVIRQSDATVPIRKVRATRGKWVRAEPVAALYAQGRVAHVGLFNRLEDQMLQFGTSGGIDSRSPDRLDALVWALTDLMLTPAARPSLRKV
ncbi:MAG: terminase family protein [Pseudomonadota bacterium]